MQFFRNLGRRRLVKASMLAVLGVVALWLHKRGEPAADWQGWARETGLGLSFAMPPRRVAIVLDAHIELDSLASGRSTNYIALYPDGSPSAVDIGDGPVLREGDAPAPFTIRENFGGNGGPFYTLYTTKDLDGRSIAFLAVIQTEGLFTPSFAEAWAVWESLRLAE